MATATDVGFIEMRLGKVVALKSDDHLSGCIVLDEVSGDRSGWSSSTRGPATR